jgi:glycosyltransferase involved in cell wall biosynthesis
MKNYLIILATQYFPTWLARKIRALKSLKQERNTGELAYLSNVDHFETTEPKKKRALVLLYPSAWLTALAQYPNIKLYNHSGFVFSLVKALNENGYLVDLADSHQSLELKKQYDLCVGHGGACRPFIDQLDEGVPIYQYIAGAYWKEFNAESEERYTRFYDKYSGVKPAQYRRSLEGFIEGIEYLNEKADVRFTLNCPRWVAGYGKYAEEFYFTGLGAYLDDVLKVDPLEKDYDAGSKNFIYVGGTSGNLQKGMDILIEAFAQTPELHLYIYCKVEEEIMRYCKKELAASNIHYIYHWRYKPFQKRLDKLLRRTNFTVHAPINTGLGTAFSASMGVGLIPVGYIDLPEPVGESAVLTDSWHVDALVKCISEASTKSPEWCLRASEFTVEKYNEHCEPDKVQRNFREMFSLVK